MNSVLAPGYACSLKGEIDTRIIQKRYSSELDVDISDIVETSEKIQWWKCPVTKLEFFRPEQLAGDGEFYGQLQNHWWYYMPEKWEYNLASTIISESHATKVLEVGCGDGAFLRKLEKSQTLETAMGLELNLQAVAKAKADGLDVRDTSISDLKRSHEGYFDVVCSFQVLEHVSHPRQFIEDQLTLLRTGGLLIFAVPNSGGFLRRDPMNLLNLPPHHMSRWFPETCATLEKVFALKMVELRYEPLAKYHIDWYFRLIARKWFRKVPDVWISRIINRLINPLNEKTRFTRFLRGHTMLASFVKQDT